MCIRCWLFGHKLKVIGKCKRLPKHLPIGAPIAMMCVRCGTLLVKGLRNET